MEKTKEGIIDEVLDAIVDSYIRVGRYGYTSREKKLLMERFSQKYNGSPEVEKVFDVVRREVDESRERIWGIDDDRKSKLKQMIVDELNNLPQSF